MLKQHIYPQLEIFLSPEMDFEPRVLTENTASITAHFQHETHHQLTFEFDQRPSNSSENLAQTWILYQMP